MKLLQRVLKAFLISLTAILCLCVVYCATSFVLSRIGGDAQKNDSEVALFDIYLLNNGVHTDIVMPVQTTMITWSRYFKYEHTVAADSRYNIVAIGWGDRGFYIDTPEWKDLKPSVAFKAAFGLGKSAIHASFYSGYFVEDENCKKLSLTAAQYQQLIDYILSYIEFDSEGNSIPIPTKAYYSSSDAFYQAKGHYSMFKTCNTWANTALKQCGQRACLWTAFSGGIFYQYN